MNNRISQVNEDSILAAVKAAQAQHGENILTIHVTVQFPPIQESKVIELISNLTVEGKLTFRPDEEGGTYWVISTPKGGEPLKHRLRRKRKNA